ncbi:hypothetical protein F5Y18DRAFT_425506 [Xylariaceae sp. FL1019]|nr:hypothetical protein F5Y18DRAFT_425506 [Xylariaceae sp. FL1019]
MFVLIGADFPSIGSHMAAFLATGSPAQIVIASGTASKVEPVWKRPMSRSRQQYESWTVYGQAEYANILFGYGLGERLGPCGLTAVAAHPEYNGDTKLGEHLTWNDHGKNAEVYRRRTGEEWAFEEPRSKTFSQTAAAPLIAALDPDLRVAAFSVYMQNSQVCEADEHATEL